MSGQDKEPNKDARAERLAEALRQNLHRRKSQARQRKAVENQKDTGPRDTSEDT